MAMLKPRKYQSHLLTLDLVQSVCVCSEFLFFFLFLCRDEVYRLLEIISSRAVELPSEEEIKKASMTAGEEPEEPEGPPVSHDNPKTFFEKNTEASNGAPWETSTPVPKSFVSVWTDYVSNTIVS